MTGSTAVKTVYCVQEVEAMDWMTCLQQAITYMEQHLLDELHPENIAEAVHVSPFYLQRGFQILTGCSLMEYVRNRRLYLAAMEAVDSNIKIIDLAYKYGYQTPESFTKAFYRFHGYTPNQMREHAERVAPFLPLHIRITIQGGYNMDYMVERLKSFQVIGVKRQFQYDRGYQDIQMFWKELMEQHCKNGHTLSVIENFGQYGICMENEQKKDSFTYMIAGSYFGGDIPDGMEVVTIPELTWAKFTSIGPLPVSLQTVNTKIFSEWLPGNQEYEIAENMNLECYTPHMDTTAADYRSEVWIPVKKKAGAKL